MKIIALITETQETVELILDYIPRVNELIVLKDTFTCRLASTPVPSKTYRVKRVISYANPTHLSGKYKVCSVDKVKLILETVSEVEKMMRDIN